MSRLSKTLWLLIGALPAAAGSVGRAQETGAQPSLTPLSFTAQAATPLRTPPSAVQMPSPPVYGENQPNQSKVIIPNAASGPNGPTPPPPLPGSELPRVIPIEAPPGPIAPPMPPRVIHFSRDTSGLVPERPPGPPTASPKSQVAADIANMVVSTKDPEAEISIAEGQSRIIQTRRDLTRIVISNPSVADVELLNDQTSARLINVAGKSFGTTNIILWDESNRPVSYLVRVTMDTKDLEARIRQAFPGADVKVRQIGYQIIVEGQVPDSKTANDVLQLVSFTLTTSQSFRGGMGGAGMGGGAMGGGMGGGGGGGMTTGAGGGGAGATAGGGRGMVIINRINVPGPRQIMLHVKIAEINRSATRDIGVSWLYARGKSVFGSGAGANATFTDSATSGFTQASGPRGRLNPVQSSFGISSTAAPSATSPLFGVFDAGHFSLFINALRTNSLAKILAEPNLVALDGQPARFLVGGLFPFPVPQSSSIPGGTAVVTVQFQRFGTILTFLPQILPNDVIRLDVEPVISQLNFAQGTTVNNGQVPSIDERSARTVVELREGQTLAIAGLLQLTTNATTTRIPGLGDLPFVGPWFSNNTVETVETETIVLVTPELVSPLEKHEVTEAPGERVYQPTDPEFYFLGRIEGKLGREHRATIAEQDPLKIMKHFQSEQHWVVGAHGHAD